MTSWLLKEVTQPAWSYTTQPKGYTICIYFCHKIMDVKSTVRISIGEITCWRFMSCNLLRCCRPSYFGVWQMKMLFQSSKAQLKTTLTDWRARRHFFQPTSGLAFSQSKEMFKNLQIKHIFACWRKTFHEELLKTCFSCFQSSVTKELYATRKLTWLFLTQEGVS